MALSRCSLCNGILNWPASGPGSAKEYLECSKCRVLIRVGGNGLDEDHYQSAYSAPGEQLGYGEFDTAEWHRWDELQLEEMFRLGYLPPPPPRETASLLDVGCGWGRLIRAARSRGVAADGFEVSTTAASRIQEAGLDAGHVFVGSLSDIPSRYDVITLFEVIEHLTSPRETLKECIALLKPGGHLIGTTGNYRSPIARLKAEKWRYLIPEHLIIWSRAALRRELHRAGFTSISVYTGAFPAPRRVLKKSAAGPVGPFNRASASAWARLATDRVASTTLTFVARKDDSMTRDDFIDTLL